MRAHDASCQDCKKTWVAALWTAFGYIYLCGPCAAFFINTREKNPKQYEKLVGKALKAA